MTDPAHLAPRAPSGIEGLPKADYDSPATKARVKARYAAEARFRRFGLAAVLVAAAFVVVLIGKIVMQGTPAFFEHRITLPLDLEAARLDPKGTRLNEDLRAADYTRVIAEALRAKFPLVSARTERRKLERVISSGGADDLRAAVLANPAMLGTKPLFPLLASTDADLHFKGMVTRIERAAGRGRLVAAIIGNEVALKGEAQAFAGAHAELRAIIEKEAQRLEASLKALPPAASPPDAALEASRQDLVERIKTQRDRLAGAASPVSVDAASMPSVLVEMDGARIRLNEITPDSAKGTLMTAPAGLGPELSAQRWSLLRYLTPEGNRRLSDPEVSWLEQLKAEGLVEQRFATRFFANGDSREPELAGIRGALTGSALTLLVTLLVCLPLGVGAAVYLEEFAPKNRFTDLLEVNINNLAAVPSIVFGLLGLAVFLNAFGLPRSAPLVGGLVLALLVLPTIIIAARAALKAVPPSIKEAALGGGASHQQAIFHHVLPLAMPGIMTGTIIGMAHALGETAPLLMIGMVAFIVEVPTNVVEAATVLPVQIYLWSDLPEVAFQAKTAAAILVLLTFLVLMNGLAILLRRRFERRW